MTDNAVKVLLKFLFLKLTNSMPKIKVPMSLLSAKRSVRINDQYIVCLKFPILVEV